MRESENGRFKLLVAGTSVMAAAMLVPQAYARDDLEARIASCRVIDDSTQRLACFDSIEIKAAAGPAASPKQIGSSQPVSGPATASPTTAASNAKPAAPTSAGPRDGTFGSETVQVKPVDQSKNLTAKAIGSFNGIGKGQRIRLDNGQVWLNTDDHSYDYEATAPDVTITRNFAGNYWMKLSDSSFQFRVRRIQ